MQNSRRAVLVVKKLKAVVHNKVKCIKEKNRILRFSAVRCRLKLGYR